MRIIGVSSGLLILTVASAALAGASSSQTVTHVSATQSRGVIRDARFSANAVESIGCQIADTGLVACFMKDAAGTNRMCLATSHNFATSAAAIGANSHLTIGYNASGTCTILDVYNTSIYLD